MLKISKNLIVVDDLYDILIKLKYDEKNTNHYLNEIKRSGKNILITCPYHKHGNEKKASCGCTYDTPIFHCFTCGAIFNLLELINFVCGYEDKDKFAEKWIEDNCLIARVDDRSLDSVPIRRDNINRKTYVSESELKKYRYYHDYMYKRGLTDDLIEKFDVGYDAHFRLNDNDNNYNIIPCITFPVRDKDGNTLFIARRSVKGKMFHYPPQSEKPVYGLYELYKYGDFVDGYVKEIVVCESILNAITCWKYGVPGVALLGTGTKEQYKVLDRLPCETLYLGLDPDIAGDNGTRKILENLTRNNIYIFDIPEHKDINDLTEEEFNNLPILTKEEWKNTFIKY